MDEENIEIENRKDRHKKFSLHVLLVSRKPLATMRVRMEIRKDGKFGMNVAPGLFGREIMGELSEEEKEMLQSFSAFAKFYHKLMKENGLKGIQYVISARKDFSSYTYQYASYKDAREWEKLHNIGSN